jgi:predicted nucleic acid-binding Zn ribbon protein
MAVIECPECGEDVSDKAEKCVHCGFVMNEKKQKKKPNLKLVIPIVAVVILIVIAIVIVVIKTGNGNVNLPFVEKETPIPFIDVEWGVDQATVEEIMGEPDEEGENEDYGHVIGYDGIEYDGYTGNAYFYFQDEGLNRVFFRVEELDTDMYDHFYNMYQEKYGEPNYTNSMGARWDESIGSYAISMWGLFGEGFVECIYMSPELGVDSVEEMETTD